MRIKDMNLEEKREYHRVKIKEWRLKNPERNKESRKKYKKSKKGMVANNKYHRKRYAENPEMRENINKYHRKRYAENPIVNKQSKEYIRNYIREYARDPKNKEKIKIRRQAHYKYRQKLLKKFPECQSCGAKDNLEIHHEIYDNSDLSKLKVLCRKCHRCLHRIDETGGK